MASVDGRHYSQKTSDSIFTHECSPCKTDDKVSEAKYYCRVCNDYLCEECKGQHRKFKELQNHKIVSAAMTTNNEAVNQAGIPGLKCLCNQNLVEFFCIGHNDVICRQCKTIKHRKCQIQTIQDKVASMNPSKQGQIMSKAKSLVDKIGHMQDERKAQKNKTIQLRDDCKDEIETFQRKLNAILDGKKKEITK